MFTVLHRRNFALLWLGQFISQGGDWVLLTALPFFLYQLTGSVAASGALFIVQAIPSLLFGSVAGVFVDRWDRRLTMLVADALRALLLLLLLVVHTRDGLWLIYIIACTEASIAQVFLPAKSALLPCLVDQPDLLAANALTALSDALTSVLFPALGGALLSLLGLTSVVLLDSASYALSFTLLLLMVVPAAGLRAARQAARPGGLAVVWQEWVAGLQFVRHQRVLVGLFLAVAVMLLGGGIINVVIVAWVSQALHGGALEFGWMLTAQGIGAMIGAILIGKAGKAVEPRSLIAGALALCAVWLGLVAALSLLFLDLLLIALIGLCAMGVVISMQTLVQQRVEDAYRGRVFASLATLIALAAVLGMGLGSVLGAWVGAVPALHVSAVLYGLAALVAFLLLRGTAANATGQHLWQAGRNQ